jgi:mxaL protein
VSLGVALLLLVVAILLPPIPIRRLASDTLVVFDITQSMGAEDYELDGQRVSRLTFARDAVRRALPDLPCGSRIGWGVFAEYRTLVLLAPIEVCANYGDLLASLDRIDGRMRWGNASEIAKGVFWAMRGARDVGEHVNVLFMSDGQEAPPLGSAGPTLFSDLKPGDIGGWLIGVGGYAPQRIPRTDPDDRPVGYWTADQVMQSDTGKDGMPRSSHEELSEVREGYLRGLAKQVGFDYLHLTSPDSLRRAILHPRFSERRPIATDLTWLAASAALVVLIGAMANLDLKKFMILAKS